MRPPLTGFVVQAPVKAPVLVRSTAGRPVSVGRAAVLRYAATASAGVPKPPVHAGRVPSAQVVAVNARATGCSGASTTQVAPKTVSGRVVKTSMSPADDGNRMAAPTERPIQLRCISLT